MKPRKKKINEEEKERIIKEFLPYIKYTAYRLSWKLPHHITIDDLISVGLIGLMNAVDRFEPGRVKLKTYAELRIRGAMIDELRAAAWVPRSMKEKIVKIQMARTQFEINHGRLPDDLELSKMLKMTLDEYSGISRYENRSNPVRLEEFRNGKYADSDLNITECIADPKAKSPLKILEEKYEREELTKLIDTLPESKKTVLSLYYFEELTMKEIGKVLNVSESRVCQIHGEAICCLKNRLAQSYNCVA